MSGFGTGPFGYVNAGSALAAAEEENRSELSSSRKFDFPTGRYVVNDEGGFEAMDDIAQVVCLTVAFTPRKTRFVTSRDNQARALAIRTALAHLTKRPQPSIVIKSIDIVAAGGGRVSESITYRNLLTGTLQTVSAA